MNNIFNIKRFGNYAMINYWYHRREYICAIIGALVMLYFIMSNFSFAFHTVEWKGSTPAIERVLDFFTLGFFITGILFTLWFIKVSMQGINGKALTMHDMLIPVSTFERYIFAIINSTIVAGGLFVIIFQITSNCVESLYLFNDHNAYLFKGFIGYRDSAVINGGFTESCNIDLKDIVFNDIPTDQSRFLYINIAVIFYTLFVSIFMWGEITFQKRGAAILTLLTHIALLAVTIAIFALSNNYIMMIHHFTGELYVIFNPSNILERYKEYLLYSLYIFPITYQWVIWKKLKTILLTK